VARWILRGALIGALVGGPESAMLWLGKLGRDKTGTLDQLLEASIAGVIGALVGSVLGSVLGLALSRLGARARQRQRLLNCRLYSFAVACSVGLFVIAHLIPAFEARDRPEWGWRYSLNGFFEFLWAERQFGLSNLRLNHWANLIGSLPSPLLFFGLAVLLVAGRRLPRTAGVTAVLAGIAALSCTLALPLSDNMREVTLLPGSYFWIASMEMLVVAGASAAFLQCPTDSGLSSV
jgi:hypothetical protein